MNYAIYYIYTFFLIIFEILKDIGGSHGKEKN